MKISRNYTKRNFAATLCRSWVRGGVRPVQPWRIRRANADCTIFGFPLYRFPFCLFIFLWEDYTSSLLIGAEGYKLASHWWRKLRARFSLVQRATSLLLIGGENCELASHWCRGLRSSCVAILLLAWYWRPDRRDRPRWRVGRTQKDRLVMEEKNTFKQLSSAS